MLFADFTFMPEQAAAVSPKIDALFFFIVGVTAFFSLLIAILVIWFAIRYRRRSPNELPPPVKDSFKLELIWSGVPLLIVLFIFAWGADIYFGLARPPDDALEIYVTGRQWMWKLQHPGGQREINTLHVPAGVPVRLILTSEDVIHSFFVPAFRTKKDAMPGRYNTTWFQATQIGEHHLFCSEYCGTEHAKMIGKIIVMEPGEYQTWLASHADGSLALEGRKLFSRMQCIICHTGTPEARAPVLGGLYNSRVALNNGQVVQADENYLRESILYPTRKVVAGYQPIMPAYTLKRNPEDREGHLTEDELTQLIAYLKSLKQGEMPSRVEDTPPPATLPEPPGKRK
jgi:cytochrome c oxidase subunit 2